MKINRRMMMIGALAVVASKPAAAAMTEGDAQALAKAWMEAINTGNVEAWINLHADMVEFANHSWFTGKRRVEMRRWGEAVVNAGGVYTIMKNEVSGDNLIWTIDYKDRSFAIQERGVITVIDGKIAKLILGPLDAQQ
jgi:hypothetical protein